MASFWGSSLLNHTADDTPEAFQASRCPDLLAFLAITFELAGSLELGLHQILTNSSPLFSDVSMGGASFDVRKTTIASFPTGIAPNILNNRDFVVVKQPRVADSGLGDRDILSEVATELQVLRCKPLLEHANIIDFLAIMYHNAGDAATPYILPALVLEYAEFGNLQTYQADGHGRTVPEKLKICIDAAQGLKALHDVFIVHGDVKPANLLVCRHSSRAFIVKVSDFGFALSAKDSMPRLVGNTKYLGAPEADEPLDPSYLLQLDIYSYGLLVFTVFKNGTAFYEAVSGEDRDANIIKLKSTGLLAATTQINLLLSMRSERCLLFLVCKVLAYSLQSNPRRRYRDFAPIIDYLVMADPSLSFPTNDLENDLLSKSQRFEVHHFWQSHAHLSEWLPKLIEDYCSSFDDKMPCMGILRSELLERARIEIEMFFGCYRPSLGATQYDFFASDHLSLLRDTQGLLAYDPTTVKLIPRSSLDEASQSADDSALIFSTNFMPDFTRIYQILVKYPGDIQLYLCHLLETKCLDSSNQLWCALANYNLAFAYTEGIGVRIDLGKARELLAKAARLGLADAQRIVLEVTAADGLYLSLKLLRTSKPSSYPVCKRHLDQKRVFRQPEVLLRKVDGYKISCADSCLDWINWEQSFLHYGAAIGLLGLVKSILDRRPDLLDKQDEMEQTPLMLALQSGDEATVQYLIARGANCRQADINGITPMHWATMLDGKHRKAIIHKLKENGADANAWVQIISNNSKMPSHILGAAAVNGTPLMWAVFLNDVDAVDALLGIEGDPNCRPVNQDECNAVELACQLHEPLILSRFLSTLKGRLDVNCSRPLSRESPSVVVQPLFFALNGGSRWSRLIRHGAAYEHCARDTIQTLIENGASCESVLQTSSPGLTFKMSAPFATAWHGCNADIMKSGLQLGFKDYIESTFGAASSGGTPLFAAITDRHYEMFTVLLENGANVNATDMYRFTPMHRAAKENDETAFVTKLAEYGAPIDPHDPQTTRPFYVATYNGNLRVAKWLWEHGANRDDTENVEKLSILGKLIWLRTRNAAERIKFILSLPDRDESDGFIVFKPPGCQSSAFHFAVSIFTEDPDGAEIGRIVVSLLLAKYREPKYLNCTEGPHRDICLGMAVEVGNYKAMQLLLEAGADPNIEDEYGRTPLDKAYWRYCYPGTIEAFKDVDVDDRPAVKKTLDYVNQNTSEILSLLTKTYNAKANVFRFPSWHQEQPGYRDLEWVIERLKEIKARGVSQTELAKSDKPYWGGLPIRIPERPIQFSSRTPTVEAEPEIKEPTG